MTCLSCVGGGDDPSEVCVCVCAGVMTRLRCVRGGDDPPEVCVGGARPWGGPRLGVNVGPHPPQHTRTHRETQTHTHTHTRARPPLPPRLSPWSWTLLAI